MYDRAALEDLFDYTTFTWESYGRALQPLPPDAFAREIPGSGWSTLRDALFHIAAAWDEWLRDRLALSDPLDVATPAMASWGELQAVREKARGWLRRVIDETSDEQLGEPSELIAQGTAAEMRASPGEVLAHILLHERGHHGDISTLLEQLGATPPTVDYLVYVWFKQRREGK